MMHEGWEVRLRRTARVALAAGIFAVVLFAVWRVGGEFFSFDTLEAVRERIRAYGAWAPLAFIALYAVTDLFLIPASLLTIASGLIFGVIGGFVYTFIGAMAGSLGAFLLARHTGARFVERMLKKHFTALARYNQALAERGFMTVLFFRLVPAFPFVVLNYALGLTRVSFRDYALATAVGIVPGALLFVFVGASLLTRETANVVVALVAALAFSAAAYRFREPLKRYVFNL